ncbi:trypsin-like peptidase domain-containing protein [candidate division WOR-3 bacterium]|nr:trypsin-like peptidase domain-containing protein [candidate division WOR-3 bacterium]
MKKILIIFMLLMLTIVGSAESLDYTNPETMPVTKTMVQSQPPVTDVEVLDFVRSVTVQIIVRVKKYYRPYIWYELAEGNKLNKPWLKDDEKKWYEMGYTYEFGDWEEPEDVLICGSGVIIFSQKYDVPMLIKNKQGKQELVYGHTLGITNWHVVEQLVDYESRGTSGKPINVYAEKDITTYTYPPSFEIKKDARPIGQEYFKVETECVYLKHDEKQLYQVRAEIVAVDNAIDVAVFRINNVFGLPYAVWRGTPCQVGEKVWICGAPLALPFSIDRGYINQIGLDLGKSHGIVWNDQVKLDIAAAPGSSGSGIFDIYGNLIAQEHGVLVYNDNYVSGGHLATNGMAIREWLIWSGYAYTTDQDSYGKPFVTTGNIKLIKQ